MTNILGLNWIAIRLLLLLVLVCPGVAQSNEPNLAKGETIHSDYLGIELTIPSGWYNATVPDDGDDIVLASVDNPKAYFILSCLPKQNRTLESFDLATRNFIFNKMKGFLDEDSRIEVDGHPAYLWVYQGESEVGPNGWRKFYRITTENNDDFIVFHAVADVDDLSNVKGSIEEMMKSVRWIARDPADLEN